MKSIVRLVVAEGEAKVGWRIIVIAPLFTAFLLLGAAARYSDPHLRSVILNESFTRALSAAAFVVDPLLLALVVSHALQLTRVTAVLYGWQRGRVPVLGTWPGWWGLPWRRVPCVGLVTVELSRESRDGRRTENLRARRIRVNCGRRTIWIRCFAPMGLEKTVNAIESWCAQHDVEVLVTIGATE